MKTSSRTIKAGELRRGAEKSVRDTAPDPDQINEQLSPEKVHQTLHDLKVHQVELEMKNDELRQSQAALDAARARYFDLFEHAPVGYCTLSENGNILESNLTAATLFNVERGSLNKKPISHFISEDDQEVFDRYRKSLFDSVALNVEFEPGTVAEHSPTVCEVRVKRRDGSCLWVQLAATIVRETPIDYAAEPQSPFQARITMTDIEERKKGEAALSETENRLRAIFNAASESIWLFSLNGEVLAANKIAAERIGRSVAELVGKNCFDLLPPELGNLRRRKIEEMIAVGDALQFEDERAGIVFHHTFYPVRDADEKIVALAAFSRDITEHKRAEAALRESELRFRSVLENSRDVIYRMNIQTGHYEYISPAAEAIVGYTPYELLALDAEMSRAMVHPDDAEAIRSMLEYVTEAGRGEMEYRQRNKNGEYRWLSNLVYVVKDDAGKPLFRNGSIRDITERKQREAELVQVSRTLRALGHINQAITRALEEPEFLAQVCRIVVEDCGYMLVWIGYAEDDDAKSVRPVANGGFEEGYLETLEITWSDTERGRGPTGTSIRTGKPVECKNMLTDPKFEPWRANAIKRGYASSLVLPLIAGGKTIGAISIYSKESDAFSNEETRLLSELAENLAFGIASIRLRLAHAKAEEESLQYSEELRVINQDLLRFNKVAVGRELRMIELKSEVNGLCDRLNLPHRYALDFETKGN
jgi:PAS domain S-box-containing protein